MENHDNQNEERWERVQNTLIDIRDGQQSIYEYLRGIELCECKDDQHPKVDLGSFMSSNEIETVDLVLEDKKSHIHEIKQLPKDKWIDLRVPTRCISVQEESTLPNKAKSKGCFEDHRTKIWWIEWENSPFEGPKIVAGRYYLIEGAVTDSYENQISLVFNKNTRVTEVRAE